jgi:hypothetical protein
MRFGFPAPLLLSLASALSLGCLFPEYTFDEVGAGGSAGSPTAGGGGAGGPGGGPSGGGPSGGGGGGGEGGGGMPPTEDCFVAGDEDDDGLADCADSDCAVDLECVPSIPVGWGTFGLVALYDGSATDDPDCPPGAGTQVHLGNGDLINTAATCSACSCSTPAWGGCELSQDFNPGAAGLQGLRTKNQACAMGATFPQTELTVPTGWDGSCLPFSVAGGQSCAGSPCNTSVEANLARPANGTCTPNGGVPQGGIPTFTNARKACRADTLQGCDSEQRCVPRFPAPFEGRACIGRVGDQVCPPGFPAKTLSYDGFEDDRECSACSCGSATGGTCKLTVSLYSDASCATPLAGAPTVGASTPRSRRTRSEARARSSRAAGCRQAR